MFKIDRHIILGVIITLAGSLLYVLMNALTKIISKHLLINHIIFLQSAFGLLCACCLLKIKNYKWSQLLANQKSIHLLRIAMSLASVYALTYGIQYISIFNALVILNSAPLIIPLFRKIFLKKKINLSIFPSALLAFAGITIILGPDRHIIDAPILIIFISMLCLSFSLLILENAKHIDPTLTIFYYFLYSSLATGSLLISQRQCLNMPMQYIFTGLIIGILFFFVQLSVVYASRYISSQLISILFYGEIIFALFASLFIDGMKLNSNILLGTTFVMIGGCSVILIENKTSSLELNPHQFDK